MRARAGLGQPRGDPGAAKPRRSNPCASCRAAKQRDGQSGHGQHADAEHRSARAGRRWLVGAVVDQPTTLSVPMGVGRCRRWRRRPPIYRRTSTQPWPLPSIRKKHGSGFASGPFFYTEQFMKIGLRLPSQTAQTTEEGMASLVFTRAFIGELPGIRLRVSAQARRRHSHPRRVH